MLQSNGFSQQVRTRPDFNRTLRAQQIDEILPRQGLMNGQTWDANHMQSFLNRSTYSNWNSTHHDSMSSELRIVPTRRPKGDYFFATQRQDKNVSKIGFTPLNPLVSNSPIKRDNIIPIENRIKPNLSKQEKKVDATGKQIRCNPQEKFKFAANSVKFQVTDPLTHHHLKEPIPSNFSCLRLKELIRRRHPHGITGIDHSESPQSLFYERTDLEVRVRERPTCQNTYELDRFWKRKNRQSGNLLDDRSFNKSSCDWQHIPASSRGYDIISGRKGQ